MPSQQMTARRPNTAVNISSPLASDSASSSSEQEHHRHTQSLSASITNYPTHWGRRYHKYHEGTYLFPNDDRELERLDNQHVIFNHYFSGQLFFSPLNPSITTKILDIGTGTGRWAIELADSNALPKAEITGIDLSTTQPREVPENVFFEIQDCCETDWNREEDSFDLIHSRFMAGSLTSYRDVIRTSKKYLKPGTGWLELHEVHPTPQCDDKTMPDEWPYKKWEELLSEASEERLAEPRPIRVAHQLRAWMDQCGYVDIHETIYKVPLCGWAKDVTLKRVGKWYATNWAEGAAGFSYKLLGVDGMNLTREEVELEVMGVRQCLAGKDGVHAYLRYWIVYGRKPGEEENSD